MIALICPSRGRPEKMKRMWQSARRTAHNPDNLHLMLGVNEEELPLYGPHVDDNTDVFSVADWSTVYTLNLLADHALKHSDAKLFMIIGDDTIFSTPEWDRALIEHYNGLSNKAHVYSLLDSRSAEGTPHPIATREFVMRMGYLATPIFLHWYVDSWIVEVAKDNQCFTHLKDYLLVHDKGSDTGQADETHTRIRARGWHERDRYVAGACKHFLSMEKDRLRIIFQQESGVREHMD